MVVFHGVEKQRAKYISGSYDNGRPVTAFQYRKRFAPQLDTRDFATVPRATMIPTSWYSLPLPLPLPLSFQVLTCYCRAFTPIIVGMVSRC